MKNKTLKTIVSALLIIICFSSLSVCAWMPDHSFLVEVDYNNMPAETAYIDFLMPISTTDDGYASYNESNGSKYNISPDSEIVNYCKDGYRSYTFHIIDAQSDMQSYYSASIYVEKSKYNAYKELLCSFDSTPILEADERYYFHDKVYLGSDKEKILKEIAKNVSAKIDYSYLYVEFNDSWGRESAYDFNYCRREYKYAKMAYLDKDGNVLAVSNTVKIGEKRTTNIRLNLSLSGQEFSSNVTTGPPVGLLLISIFVLFAIWAMLYISGIVVGLIIIIKKVRKNRLNNHN